MATIYAVLFEDDDRHADKRPTHMEAHLAFLKKNANSVLAAGPLTDSGDRKPAGGLWLVTADTAEQVAALVRADPFWPTGLRKSVRILEWKQVHGTLGMKPSP
ncbi:MAG TPA: YciI family protein [Aestuariivirga sp.]|nr:YciI family protein [Aestuariivirga sp.]